MYAGRPLFLGDEHTLHVCLTVRANNLWVSARLLTLMTTSPAVCVCVRACACQKACMPMCPHKHTHAWCTSQFVCPCNHRCMQMGVPICQMPFIAGCVHGWRPCGGAADRSTYQTVCIWMVTIDVVCMEIYRSMRHNMYLNMSRYTAMSMYLCLLMTVYIV